MWGFLFCFFLLLFLTAYMFQMTLVYRIQRDTEKIVMGKWSEANGTISEIPSRLITEIMRKGDKKMWSFPPMLWDFYQCHNHKMGYW